MRPGIAIGPAMNILDWAVDGALGALQEELLAEAFQPFGRLQGIKLLRDKGGAVAGL